MCYSCFGYENMSGHSRRNIHGTGNVLPQLVHTVRMQQKLPVSSKRLCALENSATIELLDSLATTGSTDTVIAENIEVKGRIKHKRIDQVSKNAIESAGLCPLSTQDLPVCSKVRYKSIVYAARATEDRQKARNGMDQYVSSPRSCKTATIWNSQVFLLWWK